MSPSSFYVGSGGRWANVFTVYSSGPLAIGSRVAYDYGVRPVINLKADTQFSGGNGTASNPYVVAT